MKNIYPLESEACQFQYRQGFTLVESMVAVLIFGFLSMSVSFVTILAMKTAHQNVYKTSAYSVMQGYLEQVKSLDNETIRRAATVSVSGAPTSGQVLQTRSISLLSEGAGVDQIDDWLVPNTLNPATLSDNFEVINAKQVVIDIDEDNGETQKMTIWVDLEVHRIASAPGEVYLIDLQFIFDLPLIGGGVERSQSVYNRNSSRNYSLSTGKMWHLPHRNEGRLQLVTSLLNIETL